LVWGTFHAIPHHIWAKVNVTLDFGVFFQLNYPNSSKITHFFTVHQNGKSYVETILPLMAKETLPDGKIVTSFK